MTYYLANPLFLELQVPELKQGKVITILGEPQGQKFQTTTYTQKKQQFTKLQVCRDTTTGISRGTQSWDRCIQTRTNKLQKLQIPSVRQSTSCAVNRNAKTGSQFSQNLWQSGNTVGAKTHRKWALRQLQPWIQSSQGKFFASSESNHESEALGSVNFTSKEAATMTQTSKFSPSWETTISSEFKGRGANERQVSEFTKHPYRRARTTLESDSEETDNTVRALAGLPLGSPPLLLGLRNQGPRKAWWPGLPVHQNHKGAGYFSNPSNKSNIALKGKPKRAQPSTHPPSRQHLGT